MLPASTFTAARARAGKLQAMRTRAHWLIRVASGEVEALSVVMAACAEENMPLKRIGLVQLLLAQPDWGKKRAEAAVESVIRRCGGATCFPHKVTVGWLIDPRSKQRRLKAWIEVIEVERNQPAWPGFPFASFPHRPGGAL